MPEITEPGWRDPFPLAMTDAAFLHVVLLRSAVHVHSLRGDIKSLELVSYKMKVIQLVNKRLQSSDTKIPDSLIIIVAFLALAEASILIQ